MNSITTPRVTVIMPVYNGARYIRQAIQSVLGQTCQDWELIVVNDGSTDATPSILAGFSDRRITVIHQPNQGEAVARNAALNAACGEYIAFLDADDLYLPNALADLMLYLDAHPEMDVVFSDGYFCDENDKHFGRLSEVRPDIYTGDILEPLVLSASVIGPPCCAMTRRSAIERHGIRFDKSLVIGPDWDFWIHLARYVQFGYLDKPTCMYRIHQTNITRVTGKAKRKADLVCGRLKIMNSDWFGDLSVATKCAFFYDLMVNLLSEEPAKQLEILQSVPFLSLPAPKRARLLRLVASSHLLMSSPQLDFVRQCLQEALAIWPPDRKSRWLSWLLDCGPSVCIPTLRGWRTVHQTYLAFCSLGRRKPKAVPLGLAPCVD